jgi:hypothetical protein
MKESHKLPPEALERWAKTTEDLTAAIRQFGATAEDCQRAVQSFGAAYAKRADQIAALQLVPFPTTQ